MLVSVGDIETTVKYLQDYLKQTLGDKYDELVDSQTLSIILQLIAIAINYSSLAQSVARRESYIETAKNENSIFEIIYNYGYIYPPQEPRTFEIYTSEVVSLYTPIGTYGRYQVIPVKYIDNGVVAVIGWLEEDSFNLKEEYQEIKLQNKGKYLSRYDRLEDSQGEIYLVDDVTELIKNPTRSILRGMYPYQSRLYFGSSTTGYFDKSETLTYKRISFESDVNSDYEFNFFISVSSVNEVSKAYFYTDISTVRSYLKYLSLDGRLVRAIDFENWIPFRWPLVKSVKVTKTNDSCCQIDLELICDDLFYVENYVKPYVNERKLLGLVINWINYTSDQGSIALLELIAKSVVPDLSSIVKAEFMNLYGFKLMTAEEKIDLRDFCSYINDKYNVLLIPKETSIYLTPEIITHSGFFKDVIVSITEV